MFNNNLSSKNEKEGLTVSVQEVVMKISNTFDNFRQNNFIFKSQAKYTTKLKRNSSPTQTLIILDFAETQLSLLGCCPKPPLKDCTGHTASFYYVFYSRGSQPFSDHVPLQHFDR